MKAMGLIDTTWKRLPDKLLYEMQINMVDSTVVAKELIYLVMVTIPP
jgi:hypothetical protein